MLLISFLESMVLPTYKPNMISILMKLKSSLKRDSLMALEAILDATALTMLVKVLPL